MALENYRKNQNCSAIYDIWYQGIFLFAKYVFVSKNCKIWNSGSNMASQNTKKLSIALIFDT